MPSFFDAYGEGEMVLSSQLKIDENENDDPFNPCSLELATRGYQPIRQEACSEG